VSNNDLKSVNSDLPESDLAEQAASFEQAPSALRIALRWRWTGLVGFAVTIAVAVLYMIVLDIERDAWLQNQAAQAELEKIEIAGTAGGGLVTVTLNGKGAMLGMNIDPTLLQPGESEILEDLFTAAHNDAKTKMETVTAEKMRELTGGMQLPPGLSGLGKKK